MYTTRALGPIGCMIVFAASSVSYATASSQEELPESAESRAVTHKRPVIRFIVEPMIYQAGFIADWSEGDVRVSRWLEGEVTPGWFQEVNPRKNKQFKITTYRCQKCGLLESHASDLLE